MTSNFFIILILLGAFQGFITAILLFRIKINKQANSLLAWLILIISLGCLNFYFLETVDSLTSFWSILWDVLPLIIFMPVGPLVYFYVKSLLFSNFRFRKSHRTHFYSVVIDLFPYLLSAFVILSVQFDLMSSQSSLKFDSFIDDYYKYSDIPRWISLFIYLILTFKLINNYNKSSNEKIVSRWVKNFTVGFTIFTAIWLLHLIPYIIPSWSDKLMNVVGYYPVFLPLIILIYWLGINGYIISFKTRKSRINGIDLSTETVEYTKEVLVNIMQKDKLYLNPSLKLIDIVKYIDIPQKTISAVLNQYMSKSFNQFVNDFRIEEFKSRILSEDSNDLTFTGIAFECGFNSQATFQRAFKSQTGMSPKEFIKEHSKFE